MEIIIILNGTRYHLIASKFRFFLKLCRGDTPSKPPPPPDDAFSVVLRPWGGRWRHPLHSILRTGLYPHHGNMPTSWQHISTSWPHIPHIIANIKMNVMTCQWMRFYIFNETLKTILDKRHCDLTALLSNNTWLWYLAQWIHNDLDLTFHYHPRSPVMHELKDLGGQKIIYEVNILKVMWPFDL